MSRHRNIRNLKFEDYDDGYDDDYLDEEEDYDPQGTSCFCLSLISQNTIANPFKKWFKSLDLVLIQKRLQVI